MLDRDAIERIMAGVPRMERAPGVGLRVVAAAERRSGRRRRGPAPIRVPGGPDRGRSPPPYRLRRVFNRIDHIGVAVEEIEPSLELYRDRFGLEVAHREIVEEQGVEAVLLDVGENHVELLAPLGADTPVGKFLAKKGPGLHHVAYQVSDIDATLAALRQAGMRADRRAAARRHSRIARRVPASARDRAAC